MLDDFRVVQVEDGVAEHVGAGDRGVPVIPVDPLRNFGHALLP